MLHRRLLAGFDSKEAAAEVFEAVAEVFELVRRFHEHTNAVMAFFFWVKSWALPGIGMFCEAYFVFSIGNLKVRLAPFERFGLGVPASQAHLPVVCVNTCQHLLPMWCRFFTVFLMQ